MEKSSITLNSEDWDYLYEGNEHLILRYCGTDSRWVGKVLRMRKMLKKKDKSSGETRKWSDNLLEENIMKELIRTKVFEVHPVIKDHTKKVYSAFHVNL